MPTLVQIMAWCWTGDKPLSEPMLVSLLMHIHVNASLGLNELNNREVLTLYVLNAFDETHNFNCISHIEMTQIYLTSFLIEDRALFVSYTRLYETSVGGLRSICFIHPRTLQWRHNECNGVSNHQPDDCLLNRFYRNRSKKTSKLRVTGLCERNSQVTGEFPTQRASNTENVAIWWRQHRMRHTLTGLRLVYPTLPTTNRLKVSRKCLKVSNGILHRLKSHHER